MRLRPALDAMIKQSIAAFNDLSPEGQAAHRQAQRESWVRGNIGIDRDLGARRTVSFATNKEREVTSDKLVPLFIYENHEVRLTDDYCFQVSGPAYEGEVYPIYETAAQAREAIDRRNKTLEKQNRAKAEIAINVIASDGYEYIIRGLNMNTSDLLGAPKSTSPRGVLPVYAKAPWVLKAVQRLNAINNERAELNELLSRVLIQGGYGRISDFEYNGKIESLKKRAREAERIAAELNPSIQE